MYSSSIINPSHQVIYLNKQRPLIFTEEYNLKHKKKTFDDIYNSPIFKELSFLISSDYDTCECLNTIEQCPRLKEILKQTRKSEAKSIFEQLKSQAVSSQQNPKSSLIQIHNQVLQPHFQSLLTVISTENPTIVAQLLRHLKTDYTTFWIYGLYCSRFPSFETLVKNIRQIVIQKNLDMDLEALIEERQKRLQFAYDSRFLSMFKGSFPAIVSLVCKSLKQDMIIEKLMICRLIKGRERKDIQVIKAAMDM